MPRRRPPGLFKKGRIWHIDKRIEGQRVCKSTGAENLEEAERFLARKAEVIRQAKVYGVRPGRSFKEAADKFVQENQHKRSLKTDLSHLKQLMPWIGKLSLQQIHLGTLQPWIRHRQKQGVAPGTINHGLKVVRRILNLAEREWMDE